MKLLSLFFITLCFQAIAGPDTPVTIDDLELMTSKNDTIEKFIANLGQDIRSQYVLMHKSRSLQGASYQNPRVIMFNKDAQMLLSFTDQSNKGGDKIEVILFDEKTASFGAHEIDFSGSAPKVNRNPDKCMRCHGQDVRPNWNTYAFWEGTYGSNDRRLSRPVGNGKSDITEYREIQKFISTYKQNSRYQYLEKLNETAETVDESLPSEERNSSQRIKSENITHLTTAIQHLNYRRFRRIMKERSDFPQIKYILLSIMSCGIDDFKKSLPASFPVNIKENFSYDYYNDDQFGIGQIRDAYYLALLEALGIDEGYLDTTYNLEYPIVKFFEPEIVTYSTSRFSTPGLSTNEFAYEFSKDDPDLKKYVDFYPQYQDAIAKCEPLANKARVEMAHVQRASREDTILKKGKRVFDTTCMNCHNNPKSKILQYSSSTLKNLLREDADLANRFDQRLNSDADESFRMPLGVIISPSERDAVKKYIETFK